MITQPGIYDVPMSLYHGPQELCAAPSISSSGLRKILECPIKYWWESPLNPDRPVEKSSPALNIGKAAHDILLLGGDWQNRYHILPDGYDRRRKEFADAVVAEQEAIAAGLTALTQSQLETVRAMAKELNNHPFASAAFQNGKPEQTLAWKDAETGVWLRIRPDFLPNKLELIPDYKTSASARPDDFEKSVWNFGYHMQAALYMEGIEAVTGVKPRSFLFVVQEKEPPYVITVCNLSERALWAGRIMVRRAVRRFAECLNTNTWPGYATDVCEVNLPVWADRAVSEQYLNEDAPIAA